MGHPAFDAKSPNKLRGLIGGFAGGNPVRFHAGDGTGATLGYTEMLLEMAGA